MVSIPDSLLAEVDGMVALERTSRSELIRQAMRAYLLNRQQRTLVEQMRRGYLEMATLNLELAEEGLVSEQENRLAPDEV
jgi:CopG family transcriptional regulator/antitoxin EndoAI